MKLKHYQYLHTLDSGSTLYEEYLCTSLNINMNQSMEKVRDEIYKKMEIKAKEWTGKWIIVNGKIFGVEQDFLQSKYEQFVRLDQILAEGDNVKNLHRLLAIYVRPKKWLWKKFRYGIEEYNLNKQDKIANELLDLDMNEANGLILFFYLNVKKCSRNINIYYLNQRKKKINL